MMMLTYVFVGLLVDFAAGGAIYSEVTACYNDEIASLTLDCPVGHIVIVDHAIYRRSRQAGCGTYNVDDCVVLDTSSVINDMCKDHEQSTCEIAMFDTSSGGVCNDDVPYAGHDFFWVRYKCEPSMLTNPDRAQPLRMPTDITWTGSLAYLWSDAFPNYSGDLSSRCLVTIPPNAEMEIKVPIFEANPHNRCSPFLKLTSGDNVLKICAGDQDENVPLDVIVNQNLLVEFDNTQLRDLRFMVTLLVAPDVDMTIVCGEGSPTTTGPPPTATSSHIGSEAFRHQTGKGSSTTPSSSVMQDTEGHRTSSPPPSASSTTSPTPRASTDHHQHPNGIQEQSGGGLSTWLHESYAPYVLVAIMGCFILATVVVIITARTRHARHVSARDAHHFRRNAFENVTYQSEVGSVSDVNQIPESGGHLTADQTGKHATSSQTVSSSPVADTHSVPNAHLNAAYYLEKLQNDL